MAEVKTYAAAYIANTEAVIRKLFKSASGFPCGIKLRSDDGPPDAPLQAQSVRVPFGGAAQELDVDLFGTLSKAAVEQDIRNLAARYAAGDTSVKQELDEKTAVLDGLAKIAPITADLALWASDYHRAVALDYLSNPNDAAVRARLNRAVESALYLFPEIQGELTPVRWRFPSREGEFYLDASEVGKAGYYRLPATGDHVRTDLSREAVNGQVLALALLHAVHPDPAAKDRLRAAVTAVAKNLQRYNFEKYVDPLGFEVDFTVSAPARRMLPAVFHPLLPPDKQLDALKGGDKLMVYSMLRAAATVDPVNWKSIANDYYQRWKDAFRLTSVHIFYQLYTLAKSKTRKYGTVLGLGGLAGAIAGAVLGGLLMLVGLPFLTIASLGLLAGIGGAVYILASNKVEIDRFTKVFETIQLEQRIVHFLLLFEDPANQEGLELWQEKLTQAFILNRRKLDALTTAYFVDSPFGKQLLAEDLVKIDQQLASLTRAVKKSKKRLCSMVTSRKKRKKYTRSLELYESLKTYRMLVFLAKAGAFYEAPRKLVLGNYGRQYSREPADYNAGGSLGGIVNKLSELEGQFAASGGLTLGAPDIGYQTIVSIPAPGGPLETVTALTDKGFEDQYRHLREPYLWSNRWSNTKHPPFRFGKGSGRTFLNPGEAYLAYALLKRNNVPI